MERLNAYASQEGDTTKIDVEGMLVDLITVWKAVGNTKDDLLRLVGETYEQVSVHVKIPDKSKN